MLTVLCGCGMALALLALLKPVKAAPQANTWFVTSNPTCTTDPCTQDCPCRLQEALFTYADDGDVIYAAGGIYTGTGDAVITLTHSISLYGAWDGASSGAVVRNLAAYPTILNGGNLRRGIYISPGITPTLDGLRVTRGMTLQRGGGIFAEHAHPVISHCRIFSNTADQGGGIYLSDTDQAMLIENNIYSNTALGTFGEGGGIFAQQAQQLNIQNNQIHANNANYGGGIILYNNLTATIMANQIYSNNAIIGGGVYLANDPDSTLSGNRIYSNTASNNAGGLFIGSDRITLAGNRIYRNNALSGNSGGIECYQSDDFSMVNNVVSDNYGFTSSGINIKGCRGQLQHNTIARNIGYIQPVGVAIGSQVIKSDIRMTNNIVISQSVGVLVWTGCTATVEGVLWFSNTQNFDNYGTLSLTHEITGTPDFLSDGYHIGLNSTARNNGVSTTVAEDIDGELRLGFPDIGVDEFNLNAFLPLILKLSP